MAEDIDIVNLSFTAVGVNTQLSLPETSISGEKLQWIPMGQNCLIGTTPAGVPLLWGVKIGRCDFTALVTSQNQQKSKTFNLQVVELNPNPTAKIVDPNPYKVQRINQIAIDFLKLEKPINSNKRDEVLDGYLNWLTPLYQFENPVDSGSLDTCNGKSRGNADIAAATSAINFSRALSGLPPITNREDWNLKAELAALIMAANNSLSHYPASNWRCLTLNGVEGARTSNLALGYKSGVDAVLGYLLDSGENNKKVGHRLWLLDPGLKYVGIGTVGMANAIKVFDGSNFSSATLDEPQLDGFRTWPTAGFFPRALEPNGRWSFSMKNADFTNASVKVISDGVELPTSIIAPNTSGAGENSIVFEIKSGIKNDIFDQTFQVEILNIVDQKGITSSQTYQVTLVSPKIDYYTISLEDDLITGELNKPQEVCASMRSRRLDAYPGKSPNSPSVSTLKMSLEYKNGDESWSAVVATFKSGYFCANITPIKLGTYELRAKLEYKSDFPKESSPIRKWEIKLSNRDTSTSKISAKAFSKKVLLCKMNKIIKKVSGINPKCPKGYKKV